ncbi:hypothetical protein [Kitasatospora sp. GP82]|uniref:hypothetical protein n=1 Tax=Kitasatospora sp. GP82 TaxID=3035089 RepID=UPI002475D9A8|nr:hypothetical protein [Kitasatospora sp. GP82]MDH6125925.1 hypothetical protein [Kitasatospora sp. GP82]
MSVYTSQSSPVPTVRSLSLATSGNLQAVVRCPNCQQLHRHLGLGVRKGPCGQLYVLVEPRKASRAA